MLTPERKKQLRGLIENWDTDESSVEVIRELLAEIDQLTEVSDNWQKACLTETKEASDLRIEIDRLRAKLSKVEDRLEERFQLLRFLESRNLLFDAHDFIRGENANS